MLAFLAAHAPMLHTLYGWLGVAPGITALLLSSSIYYLYAGGTPVLAGGHQSLVYFREIAKRREAAFIDEFRGISEEEYLTDLLGQVWRNSEILASKFDHLQRALLCLALAIFPWLISLITFALITPIKP